MGCKGKKKKKSSEFLLGSASPETALGSENPRAAREMGETTDILVA
jgi:hypothetical protein